MQPTVEPPGPTMTGQPPGGDPRFGPPVPSQDARFGPPAAGGGVVDNRFGGHTAIGITPPAKTGVGGFAVAAAPAASRPRRRTGTPPWLTAAVVTVVLGLAAGMFAVYHAQAARTKAARAVFDRTTLTVPDTAAGLTHGTGPGVASAEQRAVLALAQSQALQTVASGWLDSDGNAYAFVAAGKHVTSPKSFGSTVDSTVKHFGSGIAAGGDAATVTLVDQDPGALGGVMRCGAVTVSGIPTTLCVAVDAGSITEALVATTDVKSAAETARVLREAVVKRTA